MYVVCQQHCPVYISNMVQSVTNSTHCQGLRWSTCPTFVVPRTRTKLGERVFSVCGPVAWNALPATICNTTDSKPFKRLWKAHFHNRSLTSLHKHYWLCTTLLDDFILYIRVHQVTIVLYCVVCPRNSSTFYAAVCTFTK